MKKILIFVDHYLPGNRFGGPVRTIANLVSRLQEYEFFILTSDRDQGDTKTYAGIAIEEWNAVEGARVLYTRDKSLRNILRRVREISPSVVYLNSFFSRTTIRVLFARRVGWFPDIPVLLAPRGEFGDGALVIKPWRKKLYIWFINRLGILDGVTLQASSKFEKADIESHVVPVKAVSLAMVAPDLPSQEAGVSVARPTKQTGFLKIIYLSRISRNKNLEGALKMLTRVSGRIDFSIHGPISDEQYWEDCQQVMRNLPGNVHVQYKGLLKHEDVHGGLLENEVLLLPSYGENFGHAILEAFAAGCPVLISDQTPWRNLEQRGVGADIPLERLDLFDEMLQKFIDMNDDEYQRWSKRAEQYGIECMQNEGPLRETMAMFSKLIAGDPGTAVAKDID
ncbi:MAG: glycosyl transferase group 1 [Acidobacteriales bacterium]|nr:glycosyl transferase group 1 [Terriglobales bacterium]